MPISHHIDLYRYWLAKRAGRSMPARRDLDPCDIPKLLPYVMIVDNVDDRLRWRLVGTAVAREAGRDLTDSNVGFYDSTPEAAAGARAIYERVFTTASDLCYRRVQGQVRRDHEHVAAHTAAL